MPIGARTRRDGISPLLQFWQECAGLVLTPPSDPTRPMHLDVHLVQRLLHPLHEARPLTHQIAQMPLQSPQAGNRLARTGRAGCGATVSVEDRILGHVLDRAGTRILRTSLCPLSVGSGLRAERTRFRR